MQERRNANLDTQKESFEKAHGNTEYEEEMKERGHVSRKGPAGSAPSSDIGTIEEEG